MGNSQESKARELRNPPALNLVNFRRVIQAGDLILIGSRIIVDSDISIPPQLYHAVEMNVKEKYSISKNISLPVWDSAGIIVDMDLTANAGKCILELVNNEFVVSEFISRMTEIKKKGFDLSLRCLRGPTDQNFRQNLLNLSEFLAGKSFDDLLNTPAYKDIKQVVVSHLEDTERESTLQSQLKEAFYLTVDNPDDFTISKTKLHDLLREFTGTNMDLSTEELADQLGINEDIGFKEFYDKWVNGPGKDSLNGEVFERAFLNGQFIKHVYKFLGVVTEQVFTISTPDDFASNYEDPFGLRSIFLTFCEGFNLDVQTPVKL